MKEVKVSRCIYTRVGFSFVRRQDQGEAKSLADKVGVAWRRDGGGGTVSGILKGSSEHGRHQRKLGRIFFSFIKVPELVGVGLEFGGFLCF